MADTLKLEIVTPQATVFSEDVDDGHAAGGRGADRRLSAARAADHAASCRARSSSAATDAIDFSPSAKGSSRSPRDHVSIVTDMAIAAEQIDEAKVEEARARAAARLRDKISDEEVASVNASLARSLAQLQVKRRRRM